MELFHRKLKKSNHKTPLKKKIHINQIFENLIFDQNRIILLETLFLTSIYFS